MLKISPAAYYRLTVLALIALTLIVLTGAAVRLTGSGLGCPDWPKCYGQLVAPLQLHSVIEYGNRVLSGFVGLIAAVAGLGAWRRRPFRRDLALLGALLPLGVVAQAVLGGFTVRYHLRPGFVMAHFGLSMLILIAATALTWRAKSEPEQRKANPDRGVVWAVRSLLPLGAITIFIGTAATAAGPHPGDSGSLGSIDRLNILGAGETLSWMIEQHGHAAELLALWAVIVWLLLRHRNADSHPRRVLTGLLGLLATQGIVGLVQYRLALPAELVWLHVVLATLTWLTILWAIATIGTKAVKPAPSVSKRLTPFREQKGGEKRVWR